MKPLSLDLRQRIIASYQRGEESPPELARRFCVSLSSVERIIRRHREGDPVAAKPYPGGTPRAIVKPGDRELIERLLAENPDITQAQLAERFSEERHCSIGRSTMGFALARLGFTRKKSR